MFVKAYEAARHYTLPVAISTRTIGGEVVTGLASFVVLNPDGWLITCAHVLNAGAVFQQQKADVDAYLQARDQINAGPGDPNQKRNKLKKLKPDQGWLQNVSYWWAGNGVAVAETYVYPAADVALCRVAGDPFARLTSYPVFRQPGTTAPGTSLVKIGYPFSDIETKFDETNNTFVFAPGSLPLTLFPIEGIFTREIHAEPGPEGYLVKLIETSSPGLKGQSGGPTVDQDGVVWAIQSRTAHLALGFSPEVKQPGKSTMAEHQFLNVGWGVHVETLQFLFARHNITVDWA